jgi:hypothetical protein
VKSWHLRRGRKMEWSQFRTTVALCAATMVALLLGNSAVAQSTTTTVPGSWVRTDLRVPQFQPMRLAGAKKAVACRGESGVRLATSTTMSLMLGASVATIGSPLASAFACSLDAPVGTSCGNIKACEGDAPSAPQIPVCDGRMLRGLRPRTGKPAAEVCTAFSADCVDTAVGGMCVSGQCDDSLTYRCDGNSFVSCLRGLEVRQPCGRGMHCGVDGATHLVSCQPDGPGCTSGARCDGAVAVNCRGGVQGGAREHRINCAEWGMVCAAGEQLGKPVATCAPPPPAAAECQTSSAKAKCIGSGVMEICTAGKLWTASCHRLGAAGACVPTGGVSGEATCSLTPPSGTTPTVVSIFDTPLFATNSLHLADRVTVTNPRGQPSDVVNSGTQTTHLGVDVKTGNVWSKGPVFAAERARVDGCLATGGTLTRQNNVVITGMLSENQTLALPSLSSIVPPTPTFGTTNVMVEPNTTRTLAPGAYGNLHVKTGGTLALSNGTYRGVSLTIEPNGTVRLNHGTGRVTLQLRDGLTVRGRFLNSSGAATRAYAIFYGTGTAWIQAPFSGTVIAPQGKIVLATVSGDHNGSFFAKNVEVQAGAIVKHWPYDAVP